VDGSGSAYVSGSTSDPSYPTTPGAFQRSIHGRNDTVVTKLNPTGTALMYSTFLGGSGDEGADLALDGAGNAYLVGTTNSVDFPTTPTAFQGTYVGSSASMDNIFVTKLNATGSALLYSSFLGQYVSTPGRLDMAVDGSGNVYVTATSTPSFPTTPGAFETLRNGNGIIVARLDPALSGSASLVYSTFVGSGSTRGIAVNSAGQASITGWPGDSDFPTTPGAPQTTGNGYITRLNDRGSQVLFSTLRDREGDGIALDGSGNAYVIDQVGYATPSGTNFDVGVTKQLASDTGPVPSLPSLTCTDVRAPENVPYFYFNVHRWGPTSQTVTVNFTTSDGTATAKYDYIATSGTLTFAPGEVTKTITVQIKNDSKQEPTETFYVVLSSATNATIQRNGTGAIENDGDGKGGGTGAGALQAADLQTSALASTLLTAPGATDLSLAATPPGPGPATLAATPVPARSPADRDTDTLDWIFSTQTDDDLANASQPRTSTARDTIQDAWLDFLGIKDLSPDGGQAPGGRSG
jgi:hypothetical protein